MFDTIPRPHPVSVEKLSDHCNPFLSTVWKNIEEPISQDEVLRAIQDMRLQEPDRDRFSPVNCPRDIHIERIAWLVVHNWKDPIHIDVGCPDLGHTPYWLVSDGNHRLAAAVFRKDDFIEAFVHGSIARLQDLLSK